jgi:hypothetical protein
MQVISGPIVRTLLTAVLGLTLAFFVAVSIIADGPWDERAGMIGVLVLGYGLIGAVLGFRASAWYGIGLALPGLAVIALLAASGERQWWYLLYAALIIALAVGGTYGSRVIRPERHLSAE